MNYLFVCHKHSFEVMFDFRIAELLTTQADKFDRNEVNYFSLLEFSDAVF